MADIATDIRLAVDSGKVAIGINDVMDSIKHNKAKLIVAASNNPRDNVQDIKHISKVSGIKLQFFEGDSMQLGAICGKPFSVSMLSVIEPGNSKILEE